MAPRDEQGNPRPLTEADVPAAARPAKAKPKFYIVRPMHRLVWPWSEDGYPLRGLGGTIVPADDPLLNCIATDGVTNMDQLHHLAPAPDGAQVSAHSNARARKVYEQLGYSAVPYVSHPNAIVAKPHVARPGVPGEKDPRINLGPDDLDVPAEVPSITAPADAPPADPKGRKK